MTESDDERAREKHAKSTATGIDGKKIAVKTTNCTIWSTTPT